MIVGRLLGRSKLHEEVECARLNPSNRISCHITVVDVHISFSICGDAFPSRSGLSEIATRFAQRLILITIDGGWEKSLEPCRIDVVNWSRASDAVSLLPWQLSPVEFPTHTGNVRAAGRYYKSFNRRYCVISDKRTMDSSGLRSPVYNLLLQNWGMGNHGSFLASSWELSWQHLKSSRVRFPKRDGRALPIWSEGASSKKNSMSHQKWFMPHLFSFFASNTCHLLFSLHSALLRVWDLSNILLRLSLASR